jgi:uncharacterized protein YndB with AHSA1/START domain
MSSGRIIKVVTLTIAAGLLVIAGVVYGIGTLLPVAHIAAVRGELPATRERVWQAITDWSQQAQWRSDVAAVEIVSVQGDDVVWVEVDAWGDSLRLVTVSLDPSHKMVTKIADAAGNAKAPFAGTWTFELDDDGPGTYIQIVEEGEVYDPLLRFVAAVFIGHGATIERYISDLRQHLETPGNDTTGQG